MDQGDIWLTQVNVENGMYVENSYNVFEMRWFKTAKITRHMFFFLLSAVWFIRAK